MNTFINYLIEVNLALCLFYLFYQAILRNENQFALQRLYLLISVLLSLLFPLVSVSGPTGALIPTLGDSLPAQWLPEVVVTADSMAIPTASVSPVWMWIGLAYITMMVALVLLLVSRLLTILLLYKNSKRYKWKQYTVVESPQINGIFSFFRFIFFSPATALTPSEKEQVLCHEEVHIRQMHSFDLLLIHVLGALCWFNPVIWLYRSSLTRLHEFEADRHSLKSDGPDLYCRLLAKVVLQQSGFVLANHFTSSFTLKRIAMMKTASKKISQWKAGLTLFAGILVFVAVACQDQIVAEISESSLTQADFPAIVREDIETTYRSRYPNAKFNYLEGDADEIRKKFSDNPQPLQYLLNTYSFPDRTTIGILTVDVSAQQLRNKEEVYMVVEETAQPKSGMEAYARYIAENLKYPKEAITMGIEGKVFVELVVNEDGKLSDFRLIKGISPDCDQEAVRVLTSGEDWVPGKQYGIAVKQRMVVPITFKLN
jgi:TonB family protein